MTCQISILIPFQSDDPVRLRNFHWLQRYWAAQLPDAEVVIGTDPASQHHRRRRHPKPFSKAVAVNNAAKRAHGDIYAVLDADALLLPQQLTHSAARIRVAQRARVHLWMIPYGHLYRLKEGITEKITESNPAHPLRLSNPPPRIDVDGFDASGWGHPFGAMAMVMPREAFEDVGGMDEKFRGWGGEDSSFMRALDTLWGKHKVLADQDVLHLWHSRIPSGPDPDPESWDWKLRLWPGQTKGRANDWLSSQYHQATGKPAQMRQLVDREGK